MWYSIRCFLMSQSNIEAATVVSVEGSASNELYPLKRALCIMACPLLRVEDIK